MQVCLIFCIMCFLKLERINFYLNLLFKGGGQHI